MLSTLRVPSALFPAPIKNTFIHYNVSDWSPVQLARSSTCPSSIGDVLRSRDLLRKAQLDSKRPPSSKKKSAKSKAGLLRTEPVFVGGPFAPASSPSHFKALNLEQPREGPPPPSRPAAQKPALCTKAAKAVIEANAVPDVCKSTASRSTASARIAASTLQPHALGFASPVSEAGAESHLGNHLGDVLTSNSRTWSNASTNSVCSEDFGCSQAVLTPRQIDLTKALAWVCRHGAVSLGLSLRPDGFIPVVQILRCVPVRRFDATWEDIQAAVELDGKQRFALATFDGVMHFRANQGHSMRQVEEDALLKRLWAGSADVPHECVHGTYLKYLESILERGLLARPSGESARGRNHIHFASKRSREGHFVRGMRFSCELAIYLDVQKALRDELPLFRSSNGVILSPGFRGAVPACYFEKIVRLSDDATIWSREKSAASPEHKETRSAVQVGAVTTRPAPTVEASTVRSIQKDSRPAEAAPQHGGTLYCRYKVGIDADSVFDVRERLLGHGGENLRFIEHEAGSSAKVEIRGTGSPASDAHPQRMRWRAPLQVCVNASVRTSFDVATSLVEELLEDVHEEYRLFCERRGLPRPTLQVRRQEVVMRWRS